MGKPTTSQLYEARALYERTSAVYAARNLGHLPRWDGLPRQAQEGYAQALAEHLLVHGSLAPHAPPDPERLWEHAAASWPWLTPVVQRRLGVDAALAWAWAQGHVAAEVQQRLRADVAVPAPPAPAQPFVLRGLHPDGTESDLWLVVDPATRSVVECYGNATDAAVHVEGLLAGEPA